MTNCPYCGSEAFECRAIPANPQAAAVSKDYGDWFNQCYECGKWSRFDDATKTQQKIDDPDTEPESGA